MGRYLQRISQLLKKHVWELNKVNALGYWVLTGQESQRHLKC